MTRVDVDVRVEFYTTYIHEEDVTIVWQTLIVAGECIQKALVGWYCGEPDEKSTAFYSNMPTIGQYID